MNNYETQNLYLAAYLFSQQIRMIHIRRTEEKRCIFVFEGTDKATELAHAYVAGTAKVNPMAYKNAINDLKNLMFRDIPFGENGGNDG